MPRIPIAHWTVASMKIMIVDDNETTLGIVRMVVGRIADIECVAFAQPALALEAARAGAFDLILLDYMMPELDGLSLAKALKADASTAHIPLLMMTGMANAQVALEAEAAQIAQVMFKPLDPIRLRANIKDALQLKEAC
jgi:CheY-like chemotaxis protein